MTRSTRLRKLLAILVFIGLSATLVLFPLANITSTALAENAQATATPADGQWYVVQRGDTLYRIAFKFNVTLNVLIKANNLRNPDLIYTGQKLWIPSTTNPGTPQPTSPATPSEGQWYVVQRGDTLFGIALRFGARYGDLITANKIANTNLIYVGQRLWIPVSGQPMPVPSATPTQTSGDPTTTPVPTAAAGQGQWYSVRRGDTLMGIAIYFGVRYRDLLTANRITNPNLIYVGQRLWIPVGGSSPTATPIPTTTRAPAPSPGLYGFGYGFQIDPYVADRLLPAVAALQSVGFGWVKIQVPWFSIEPNRKGEYAWSELDGIMNQFNAAGLKVMLSVVKAPQWARPANTDRSVEGPPANVQDLADIMAVLAERYKGRLHAIEVWNEQNLSYEWGNETLDAGRYVELLCASYRAIKAVDPTIAVISGGLTPTGVTSPLVSVDDLDYLRQMYARGCKNCMDGLGAHPSGYNNPPDARASYTDPNEPSFKGHRSFYFQETMLSYREVMAANGDSTKLIWPTEFGWASASNPNPGYEYARDVSEAEQAQYLVKAYQMMKSWGWVGPAFCWNLNFNVTRPGTELAQFGVMGRPAFDSLRDMAK
ncbi:MAG: LysM peptidoglycan-binding domain-containing protein [Anaerolineae bacterium]